MSKEKEYEDKVYEALWRLVDSLDELRTGSDDKHPLIEGAMVRLDTGDEVTTADVFAAALTEILKLRKRLLIARRATDLLCSAVDVNAGLDELDEDIADTDVLDCQVGACDHEEHRAPRTPEPTPLT